MRYAAVIPTLNRPESVATAISCLLDQTVPPAQIVIVDASPNHEEQKRLILERIEVPDSVDIQVLPADVASITVQRNQGIERLADDIDVVFCLDDDSYLYPDGAEQILDVYAADPDHHIAGVQASLVDRPPSAGAVEVGAIDRKAMGSETGLATWARLNLRSIWANLLLMSAERLFIPYDGTYPEPPADLELPEELWLLPLFHGCRMTFRTEVVRAELFDNDLVRYAPAEDLDLSYRASRHGALVECTTAAVYHHTADGGRVTRYEATRMGAYNVALFLHKHSNDLRRDIGRYRMLFARRLLAELLKDTLTRRFTLPQLRGVWAGSRLGLRLLAEPRNDQAVIERYRRQFGPSDSVGAGKADPGDR